MTQQSAKARQIIADIAERHSVSTDAVEHLLDAVIAGNGTQAQFNHPQLGGMGQWSSGGMIMIGDMFNSALKIRVEHICTELSQAFAENAFGSQREPSSQQGGTGWPADLGRPASSGAQNNMRYAVFPASSRLAVSRDGETEVYDTGEHQIFGVSQQQGSDQSMTFTSQLGQVRLSDLRRI